MNGYDMMGFGYGWMIFGLIFWILLIVGLVLLVRWVLQQEAKPEKETPIDILKKRYALGEISKEEFEEKKRDLI